MPLNQVICQAIETERKNNIEIYEGGEEVITSERVLTTERNLQTERGLMTEQDCADEDHIIASLMKSRKEARLRLQLEDLVDVNPRYETLFTGLKLNQPRNSAVVQPFTFIVRRILYAALIVFMPHLP